MTSQNLFGQEWNPENREMFEISEVFIQKSRKTVGMILWIYICVMNATLLLQGMQL